MYSMNGVDRPSGSTRWLGRNLSASGLGVFSVWMKIVRLPPAAAAGRRRVDGWWRGWRVGRREEDVAPMEERRLVW
jgi:hypothetical protein